MTKEEATILIKKEFAILAGKYPHIIMRCQNYIKKHNSSIDAIADIVEKMNSIEEIINTEFMDIFDK